KGIMIEQIKKVRITEPLDTITLTNNNIFRIYLTENSTVATTLDYTMTTEANRDNIANRNQMYIGSDNYLYIIKANNITELENPFWVFNRRDTPVKIKINTTIPLLDKNDSFVFESYRYLSDNIVGTSYQFVR